MSSLQLLPAALVILLIGGVLGFAIARIGEAARKLRATNNAWRSAERYFLHGGKPQTRKL